MIDAVLERLTKVRGRNGAWTACCPAHSDKSPSLAIREEGGKIVMHCFAGCAVNDIVAAIGLEMSDLFPPRQDQNYAKPAPKVKLFAADVLRCIAFEASIVSILARDIAKGKTVSPDDMARAQLAYERISAGLEATE